MSMARDLKGGLEMLSASDSGDKRSGVNRLVAGVLALWLGVVVFLGARGTFFQGADSPPLAIFVGFAIPLVVFFSAYFGWSAFRAFVLGVDLRLAAAVQAWRWAGFGFLTLYAHGLLPALFAFPAGLGDMAVAIAAPWMVLGLIREPSFATSRRFVTWNLLGIVDLIVAVSMGAVCSGFLHGLTGRVTTSAMSQLPLLLIPVYFVPLFMMLHFTALTQAWRLACSGKSAPQTKNPNPLNC
jgi:hypothetical protein